MAVDTSRAIKKSFHMTPEENRKMVNDLKKVVYTKKPVKENGEVKYKDTKEN